MRMWMVHPECLCDRHLLGEHSEIHMLAGAVRKGKRLNGYLAAGQLAPQHANSRHRELAFELHRRGFAHRSPLAVQVRPVVPWGVVDANASSRDLANRCAACRGRMTRYMQTSATELKLTFSARIRSSKLWSDPLFERGDARAMQQVARAAVEVSWRMSHTAGRAWRTSAEHDGRPLIKLSGQLLAERVDQFCDTVLHELSHVFVMHAQKGAKPHGRLWQAVARAAGCAPKRCHDLEPARDNRIAFACGCRSWKIGRTRAKRVISDTRQYRCPHCGQNLKPAEEGAYAPRT